MVNFSMRFSCLAALSLGFLAAGPAADDPRPTPVATEPDPVQAAFKRLEDADNDWHAEDAASKELARLGDKAVWTVIDGAEEHEKPRVRRACYSLLTQSFSKNDWAIQAVIRSGLADKDEVIRQHCAFWLGELEVYRAHRDLRRVLDQAKGNDWLRFTAAKSLAELGEPDVLRTLYEAVTNDWYMSRHFGNIGLKALSGKSLDDFDQYTYGEGAFVSGGKEATTTFDAVVVSERKAKRYQAATSYFKWLQAQRPDLHKHVTGAF